MSDSEPTETDGSLDAATQRRVVRERDARIATETDRAGSDCGSSNDCSSDADTKTEGTAEVPAGIRADPDSVASCVAGGSTIDRRKEMLAHAGFEQSDVSAGVTGRKPGITHE
ncbi:hypothetical protein VB773_10610 [Haloarculaceae archaeon H-GB2-1]|nr:hypothetical protein [Haloarculaceae archaeon H-GB1-1]MEA5386454.1 hypothetical protein [Haloarculaceae archaeon H-GB11]MEA5407965.1 hypothetical protein [Haloarculaceae archaeon H-GB2-1]